MSDSDTAAITLLKRAVELDLSKRYTEALVCYKEGLQLLLEFIKVVLICSLKRSFRKKYLDFSDHQ